MRLGEEVKNTQEAGRHKRTGKTYEDQGRKQYRKLFSTLLQEIFFFFQQAQKIH